jgi:hypothetical protein
MVVRPKLMIGAGLAIAGLGLVGAGAGATFTAQVSTDTEISSGGVGLSLNGGTGSGLRVVLDGKNLGSHFAPISTDLRLKNTGTLDLASHFLSVTATGCDGGTGADLAQALHLRLTDVTNQNTLVYDGALCSFASSGGGFITPPAHSGVGGQLPHALKAGDAISYQVVIQPSDAAQGLPTAAQNTSTSVSFVFSGFDY